MASRYSYKGVERLQRGTAEAMLATLRKDPHAPADLVAGLQERIFDLDFQSRQIALFEDFFELEATR